MTQGPTAIAAFAHSFGPDNLPHQRTVTVGSSAVETDVFQTDDWGRITAEQALAPGLSGRPTSFGNSDAATAMTAAGTQYALDGASNWQARLGPSAMTNVIDTANRYTQINGETVQNVSGGGISSYQALQYRYDGLDELTYATDGAGGKQRLYDAIGRSSIETDGQGNSSQLIWDGAILIGTSPLGTTSALSVHAGFSAQGTLAVVDPDASSALLFHGPDDSVFAAADSSGKLLQAYTYSAYGDPHVWTSSGTSLPSSAAISLYLFQGAIYDPSLALYHMGMRSYSASLGRFLSPDPIGQLGGLNLFAFVGGRPLTMADPTGTNGRPANQDLPTKDDATILGADLVVAGVWKVTGLSVASSNLLHSIFGNGEAVHPDTDWILKGRAASYSNLLNTSIQDSARAIAREYQQGVTQGRGSFNKSEQFTVDTGNKFLGLFNDQYWAIGGATDSVSGAYNWHVTPDGQIDMTVSHMLNGFVDDYRFRDDNRFTRDLQDKGLIKPFPITKYWLEYDKSYRFDPSRRPIDLELPPLPPNPPPDLKDLIFFQLGW